LFQADAGQAKIEEETDCEALVAQDPSNQLARLDALQEFQPVDKPLVP
jgi:hypothetical protein